MTDGQTEGQKRTREGASPGPPRRMTQSQACLTPISVSLSVKWGRTQSFWSWGECVRGRGTTTWRWGGGADRTLQGAEGSSLTCTWPFPMILSALSPSSLVILLLL